MLQLSGSVTAPALLPTKALNRIIKGSGPRQMERMLNTYADPQGSAALRAQIARRLPVLSGLTAADDLVITNGCIEAVSLCLRALAGPGDAIVVESPTLNQQALAVFLQTEGYERHLRRLRQALKNQAARLALAVNRYFPAGTRLSTPRGGLTLWVEYNARLSGLDIFNFARRRGIAILPGTICSTTDRYRHCIRLSFGFPWSDALEKAVRLLGEFVAANRAA